MEERQHSAPLSTLACALVVDDVDGYNGNGGDGGDVW